MKFTTPGLVFLGSNEGLKIKKTPSKAILLYSSLGFRLQKTDSFSHYVNEYEKAMTELRKTVPEDRYELLKQTSED